MTVAPINWADPCEAAVALRGAYYKMLNGSRVQTVQFIAGNGTQRMITFEKVDINLLREELRRAENECAKKQGEAPRRHAILGGFGCRRR